MILALSLSFHAGVEILQHTIRPIVELYTDLARLERLLSYDTALEKHELSSFNTLIRV